MVSDALSCVHVVSGLAHRDRTSPQARRGRNCCSTYGAPVDFLTPTYGDLTYTGIDIAVEMIDAARRRFERRPGLTFVVGDKPSAVAAFSVSSGIFNVRLNHPVDQREEYILKTIDMLHESSSVGFAFNCLTSYSDRERHTSNSPIVVSVSRPNCRS